MRRHAVRLLWGLLSLAAAVCWTLPAAAKDFLYVPLVNTLQIIDCDSDTVVGSLSYNDYIIGAMLSPDGKRYYLNAVHSIYVVDTETDTLIDTHKLSSELNKVDVLGFGVSADGSRLYLSCSIVKKKQNIPRLNVLPPQFVIYDLASRKMVKNHPIPAAMTGIVTLKNDPSHVILVGLDIHKLNLETGELEKMMGVLNPEEGQEVKNSLVIWQNNSPDDHGLFTNPYYTPTGMGYFVIDKNAGTVSTLAAKDVWLAYSTVVSPDRKYLYAVMDELIKVDMATGETVKRVLLETGTNYALSLSSDGKKIYVGPAGADMSVYDTETLALKTVIPLAGDGVTAHRLTKK